jgi:3-(3-hydroxy-phenyl)propionate hydroxylase
MRPGSSCLDAPIAGPGGQPEWLLERLGNRFTLLLYGESTANAQEQLNHALVGLAREGHNTDLLTVLPQGQQAENDNEVIDREGVLAQRYDLQQGSAYLIRPDQHVCARWRTLDPDTVVQAVHRALGHKMAEEQAA